MDAITAANLELEQYLDNLADELAPVCKGCGEFVPSEQIEYVGSCFLHGCRVLAHDRACSNFYVTESEPGTSESDEF